MANAASTDRVSADMKPVDYRAAVNRMKGIKAKTDKMSSISGEIADIYAKVEGHGVDKRAAKIYHALSKLEVEDLTLVFRDLNGLLDASGMLTENADLVDQAQDKVVHMRLRKKAAPAETGDDGDEVPEDIQQLADDGEVQGDDFDNIDDGDTFTEASDEELAQQQVRKTSDPDAPFTGDNSDLTD